MRPSSKIDTLLEDPQTLARHIADDDWLAVDCRAALGDPDWGRAQYDAGHIAGAVFASLDDDLAAPAGAGGRHPLPDRDDFARVLGSWGVTKATRIVAYDADAGMYACRLWWLARWMGITNVAVLDGGFAAWQRSGGPVDTAIPTRAASQFVAGAPLTRSVHASDILEGNHVLVDARAQERFDGITEPIDFKAGHIPGAVCMPFDGNLTADGVFDRNSGRFAELESSESVVCYCGSGVTATHNILAMMLSGLAEPALYAGSWSEWIEDPQRPIEP